MTAETIAPETVPTAEAIRQTLAFLSSLAEQKPNPDDSGKPDLKSLLNSDILKAIEAALKTVAETKAKAAPAEADGNDGKEEVDCAEEEEVVQQHLAEKDKIEQSIDAKPATAKKDPGAFDEELGSLLTSPSGGKEEDNEDDEHNPFAGTYYWNPGPEWKTIGLVAGGAALVGLGALLYKIFDD